MPTVLTRLTWFLFVLSLGVLAWQPEPEWTLDLVLRVDGLTYIMGVITTFVSAIVHSFSRRYMAGTKHLNRFFAHLFGLTLIVLLLTAVNHIVLFVVLWTLMGWVLANLIGHIRGWPQAQAAGTYARRFFLGGSALLAGSLGLLSIQAGTWAVDGVLAAVETLSTPVVTTAAILLLLAAMIQSALVPFHRWLLSSMTAPTPVSAFMHAGLVNAGGVLLARFAPVVFEQSAVMLTIVVVGAASALMGQAWMLVQTDVKRQLGSSTVAQMGFMVLQTGLGFVPASITHLLLHGLYKAYLFLASGSVVEHTHPRQAEQPAPSRLSGLVTLATGLAGGALFAFLTGKPLTALDSSTFLTIFVVLAVLHAARSLLRQTTLSPRVRLWAVPIVLLPSLGVYAVVYNGVTALLSSLPGAVAPTGLTPVHWTIVAVFVLAYVAMDRGWHRASTRLYVTLLNTSQPVPEALLHNREEYNAY